MPMKMSGCGCCGGCRTTRELNSASSFTTGTGGTITANGIGFDVSGEVSPPSLISAEAYLISFDMEGSVSITIGSDTVAFDANAQTMTVNATSQECGISSDSPSKLKVYIRVTPTHIAAWAIGNYRREISIFGSVWTGGYYGIMTVDRSSSVPTSITMDWTSAYFENFEIADSTVQVSGTIYEPSVDLSCFTPPTNLVCNYPFAKNITRNHLYKGTTGDIAMPYMTVDQDDPITIHNTGATPISGLRWTDYDSSATLPDVNDDFQLRFTSTTNNSTLPNFCFGQGKCGRWFDYDGISTPRYQCYVFPLLANYSSFCNFAFSLVWPDPLPGDEYPKPYFNARVFTAYSVTGGSGLEYASAGDANVDIAVNDLSSGFTLSCVAAETVDTTATDTYDFLVGATWSYPT